MRVLPNSYPQAIGGLPICLCGRRGNRHRRHPSQPHGWYRHLHSAFRSLGDLWRNRSPLNCPASLLLHGWPPSRLLVAGSFSLAVGFSCPSPFRNHDASFGHGTRLIVYSSHLHRSEKRKKAQASRRGRRGEGKRQILKLNGIFDKKLRASYVRSKGVRG